MSNEDETLNPTVRNALNAFFQADAAGRIVLKSRTHGRTHLLELLKEMHEKLGHTVVTLAPTKSRGPGYVIVDDLMPLKGSRFDVADLIGQVPVMRAGWDAENGVGFPEHLRSWAAEHQQAPVEEGDE